MVLVLVMMISKTCYEANWATRSLQQLKQGFE